MAPGSLNGAVRRLPRPAAVLFDLDGTLIDSSGDIADSVNLTLAEEGKDPLAVAEIEGMIGHGVAKLIERAFLARGCSLDPAEHARLTDRMMAHYVPRCCNKTALLPGAAEAVAHFAQAGVPVGVVTNKPQGVTETILRHCGLGGQVGVVIGGDCGLPRKPDPAMLLAALEWLGAAPDTALMIGDSTADAEAGRRAGMTVVIVRSGYGPEPVAPDAADAFLASLRDVPERYPF